MHGYKPAQAAAPFRSNRSVRSKQCLNESDMPSSEEPEKERRSDRQNRRDEAWAPLSSGRCGSRRASPSLPRLLGAWTSSNRFHS